MPDSISKEKRREIMSKIKSKNTKLEIEFRKKLWNKNLKYRLHYKISGKPDLVFVSKKIAVFVDSCFWHKCPKHFRQPKSRLAYWKPKIERNTTRDKKVNEMLKNEGWKVLRFWEHEIKKNPERCVKKIENALKRRPLF